MTPQVWWYVARSSGIVAWVLVTASVVWGLSLTMRLTKRPRPAWVLDLHRFLGGLAVIFTAVHLVGLIADSYVFFGAYQILIPFAATWKPAPVAIGIVAMYLLVAVEGTSLFMKHLPREIWHRIHMASYGVFVLVTAHALLAGTDTSSSWARMYALASGSLVAVLTMIRVLAPRPTKDVASRIPAGLSSRGATSAPASARRAGSVAAPAQARRAHSATPLEAAPRRPSPRR
jgi:DMSO/TMAO reductase YedYZ heme-binding membrane subunit